MNERNEVMLYQQAVREFRARQLNTKNLTFNVLGLVGEAGEVANTIKKLTFYENTLESRTSVAIELGDVLFHIVSLADHYGFSFSDIIELNLEKLERLLGEIK